MRATRDAIVHDGGQPVVFPPSDDNESILFQVVGPQVRGVLEPELMPENVVDLNLYAGVQLGYTLAFLDQLGGIAGRRLEGFDHPLIAYVTHGGLSTAYHSIERVLQLPVVGGGAA